MLHRRNFLMGTTLLAGILAALSACDGASANDADKGLADKTVGEDNGLEVTWDTPVDPSYLDHEVELTYHTYRLPNDVMHSDPSEFTIDSERIPNIYFYVNGIALDYDDETFELVYGVSAHGFDVTDVFEYFLDAEYQSGFAREAFGFTDINDDIHNPRTEVDHTEVVNVNGVDAEHVTGRFICDEGEIPFVAYVAVTGNEVCCSMAADAAAAQNLGHVTLEDEDAASPSAECLEDWAKAVAETLSDKVYSID